MPTWVADYQLSDYRFSVPKKDLEANMSPMKREAETTPRRRSRGLRALLTTGTISITAAIAVSFQLYRQAASVPTVTRPAVWVRRNAPFIKSPDEIVDEMIQVAQLTPDDVVYDLGCGDGRIVITAALQSGCRGIGFDIDPHRVAEARENAKLHGVEELVEIREQDIFELDLSEADVVMCYLLPWMIKKLIPQLQRMKPGTRFISHDFAFGDTTYIPPDSTSEVFFEEGVTPHFVHLWTLPLTVPEDASTR